jgi:hypothetical protein
MHKLFVIIMVLMSCLTGFTNVSATEGEAVNDLVEDLNKQKEEIRVLKDKIDQLEESQSFQNKVGIEIETTGAIEVEAIYSREEQDGINSETSDLELSSIEIGIAVKFTDYVMGYVQFESDDSGEVTTEEGLVHFRAEDVMEPNITLGSAWYASFGKMTVPFGYYESHLPSDSYLTRKLGKAEETALVVGAYAGAFNLAIGMFNGDVSEIDSDDHIDTYTCTLIVALPEDVVPGLGLKFGGSYISNITDSKKLEELFPEGEIEEYVPGISSFISVAFKERFFIEAEYVGSTDTFLEEENRIEPIAWNFEFAFLPWDALEIAVRYGFSETPPSFLPERQLGVAGIYQVNDYISISLEYLSDEFENDDLTDTITLKFVGEI